MLKVPKMLARAALCIAAAYLIATSSIAVLRWKDRKDCEKKKEKQKAYYDSLWNTAIFFPDFYHEQPDSNTAQLMWYLDEATESVDIVMYSFSFPMLENLVRKKARQGVKVRILTDKYIRNNRRFRRDGAKTRVKIHRSVNPRDPKMFLDLLHHKFVVIDKRASLSGSLNWTWSGITENKENVCVTTNERIVNRFKDEFERLWEDADPRKIL